MRVIRYLFSTLSFALAIGTAVPAADQGRSNLIPGGGVDRPPGPAAQISFQAILVIASDEGTSDASLGALESTLRRVLRFKSFRRAGAGSATVAVGASATAVLGGGHTLDIWVSSATDEEVIYGVRWFDREQTLANTKVTRPRRAHTVIGGPPTEDGKGHYAVILTTS